MRGVRVLLAVAAQLVVRTALAQPEPATAPPRVEPRRTWREILHGLRQGPSFELIEVGGADGRLILVADDAGFVYRTPDAGETWQESRLTPDEDPTFEIPLPRLEEILPPNVDLFDSRASIHADFRVSGAARIDDEEGEEDEEQDGAGAGGGGGGLTPRDRAEDPGDLLSRWAQDEGHEAWANWMTTCETDDDRVYTATDEGLFRSDDQGITWVRVFIGANDAESQVLSVLCGDEDADDVYIGTSVGFFSSHDGGLSWARPPSWTGGLPICYMEHDAVVPGRLFVGSYWGAYSTANGETFDDVWYPLAGTVDARSICAIVSTEHHLYLGSYDGGVVSHDGGRTFEPMGAGYLDRSVINMMMVDPRDEAHVYVVTDGTFWETRDAGLTVRPLLTHQAVEDLTTFTMDPNDSDRVYLLSRSQLLVLEPDRPRRPASATDPVARAAAQELAATPSLGEVTQATLVRNALDRETIVSRRDAARSRNAWPIVSVGAAITDILGLRALAGLGSIGLSDSVYETENCRLAVRPPNCYLAERIFDLDTDDHAGLLGWGVGVVVRWSLPLLEFDRAESNSIWNDVIEVQKSVMDSIAGLWFERGRTLRELADVAHTPAGARALGLRAAEMTATLDALSGGVMSRRRREVRR